jgi:hypothetical protein
MCTETSAQKETCQVLRPLKLSELNLIHITPHVGGFIGDIIQKIQDLNKKVQDNGRKNQICQWWQISSQTIESLSKVGE